MSSYSARDTYSQAGDWLLGAVRRNPEALLLMAAGCCLMMRSGRSSSRASAEVAQHMRDEWDHQTGRAPTDFRRASSSAREGLLRAGECAADTAKSAGDYASQVKDHLTDTVSDYGIADEGSHQLKTAAEERGLTSEGLKEVAGEVAETFKDAMSGKPEDRSSASPGSSAAAGGSSQGGSSQNLGSQNFGTSQNKPGGSHGPNAAGTSPGGRSTR